MIIAVVLCFLAVPSLYFGLKKIRESKKTVQISVTDLQQNSDNQPAEIIPEVQQSEDALQSAEKPINNDEAVVIENQEKEIAVPKHSEKISEEKTVESEKTAETKGGVGKIVDKLISWGFTNSSGRVVDTIIVHSSYDALGNDPYSVSGIIAEYKQYNVSAHYLIARDGVIYRLVKDENIAWHAGVSKVPDERTNVNDFSIGIEMINTEDGKYSDEQYNSLNSLIGTLQKKYKIKYILGHNEIAPGRKTDPWNIEWGKVRK
ncbi:MAG: N-acetylmuramyl-L-alanine amidase, negative regulator of AmpC, AmpD [Parcubacteria group bacterium GW2011_GWD2_38_11]|nr:MAG: N-acetylmuramyl-L-alanine amidase, negative regulator of AmpC, AmpD [Parcubacteria group bacterium GW2011_GWD2_38_11]